MSVIEKNGDAVGFKMNDKEFYFEDGWDGEVQLDDLRGFNISSIPDGIWLYPLKGDACIIIFLDIDVIV